MSAFAVVQHGMGAVEMGLHPLGHGAQGRARGGAGGLDFGKQVGREGHGLGLSHEDESPTTIDCGLAARNHHMPGGAGLHQRGRKNRGQRDGF